MSLSFSGRGSSSLLAALLLSIGLCTASSYALASDPELTSEPSDSLIPGSDHTLPPARYFTINSVLAKLDSGRRSGPVRLASLAPPNVAIDAPPLKVAPIVGHEPFGLFSFRAPDGMLWRKWRGVEADISKEQTVLDRCRADAGDCPSYAAQFLRLVGAVKSKSGKARLDEANRGVNMAIRYVSDMVQYGVPDRWSSPLATFATAKGDCEDYAIAKYAALRESGFPQQDLRLVLVRDRAVRQDHAVLAARLDDRWLILDNRRSEVVADSEATNLSPLFAINHGGVYLLTAPYANRGPFEGEIEAAPAAAGINEETSWTGIEDVSRVEASQLNVLPLLL